MPRRHEISNAIGTIPPGQYLLLGDHRDSSNDSHVWGLVPRSHLLAKPMAIYWPVERTGTLN